MKKMRWITSFFLSVFLFLGGFMPLPLQAAGALLRADMPADSESLEEGRAEYVIDDRADLFSEDQEKEIAAKLDSVIEEHPDVALAVYTTPDTGGKKIRAYGEDLFEGQNLGYGPDFNGVFIVIEMSEPSFYVGTYGKAIKILTDERISDILDSMKPELKQGEYSNAVITGLERISYYEGQGIPEGQYEYKENRIFTPVRLIISLVVFVLVSILTAFGFKKKIEAEYDKYAARPHYDPVLNAREEMAVSEDVLLDKHVTRSYQPVPRSDSSGSSGRSTTHTTSGGRSSGGGGSSF